MRIYIRYVFCLIFCITVMGSCHLPGRKRLPSLKESYRKTDKLPFGSYVAYNRLQAIFQDYGINIVRQPFDETWQNISHSTANNYSLYFLVTKNLILSDRELKALVKYVGAGNDIFISADFVDNKLLQTLFTELERKAELENEMRGKMRDTYVSIFFGNKITAERYNYYYFPFLNSIKSNDPNFTRILGVNELNQPNYALFFLGKGRIYLHVAPRIFSNYFLLSGKNYEYFDNMISFVRLEPKRIYWDEYYKNVKPGERNASSAYKASSKFSSLRVVTENPPLLWAFSIAVAGMLLYVIFNIKRKQRIIEIIPANSNSTVAFTETVGRLYFQYQNNRHVADNMITYFYEYIRNKYFIKSAGSDSEFIILLAGKSGVSKEETGQLFTLIKTIQKQDFILDEELMELNVKIESFKNKSDGRKPG